MKKLLFSLTLLISVSVQGQYADTLSCYAGAFEFVVNYDQQTCTATCNGNYNITILNGVGPYTYSITGPGPYNNNTNIDSLLCPGAYVATVTDVGQGMICFLNFNIDALVPTTYGLNITPPSSFGACDGIAEIIVSGGVPHYTYQWYDAGMIPIPLATTYQISGLCAGTYYVQYWDNTPPCGSGTGGPGAGGSGAIAVVILDPVTVTITNQWEASCPGACNASIEYTVSGGSGNYIDPNGGIWLECDGGSGTITICDDLGSCGSAFYSLTGWPPVDIYTFGTDESCAGECDGSISVDDQWAPGADTYSIDGGFTWQSSQNFNNLCPGSYEILATIPDAGYGGYCEISLGYTTIQGGSSFVPSLSVSSNDESCTGSCNGTINITDLGGDVVSYNIGSGYVPSGNFSGLCQGTYNIWVQNATGCYVNYGSVVVNSIAASNTGTDVQSACDTYTWIDGNTYTASNSSATHTLTNVAGCDSVVTLNLTLSNSNTGTDVQTACDTYTWIDGNTYTASNSSATHTLTNVAGCDSVVTLNLTLGNSNTGTDVQLACDTYIWIDGNTYTASNSSATHTLTNVAGCDSVVTLNLTLSNSNTGTDVQTGCDTYTWIDGNTYTASNSSATHTLTNVAGCDSVVTLNLTLGNSNTGTDVQTACDTYTWIDGNTYTASNSSATHTLTNVAGCDSVVHKQGHY
jgi:hypothetical protein